jgi:transcriptional regulator with XRE-family HTH domain
MDSKKTTLGKRLRELRGDQNPVEFAKLLNVGKTALYAYESDARSPDATSLAMLAVHFGISIDWLVFGKGESTVRGYTPNMITLAAVALVDFLQKNKLYLEPRNFAEALTTLLSVADTEQELSDTAPAMLKMVAINGKRV